MRTMFAAPLILFYLFSFGLSSYCLILFIKLAHRGIKALDIYINKNDKSDTSF